ncbi:MAG TPA: hypothetical protein VNT23_06060, partial [Gaiellaceae bacterium]|nr:hypothetical protein [Gaiellaceae bacterium]
MRRRTWLALWGGACALAVVYALVYPTVLSPRLRPLADRALAADVQQLGRSFGLPRVEVEVRRAAERTRAVNAEAIGAGPTTRVILWDTLLRPEVGRSRSARRGSGECRAGGAGAAADPGRRGSCARSGARAPRLRPGRRSPGARA